MKKCLALILSAAMVLSLAACGGGGKDAKVIYDEASKKTSELTELDISTTADMKMSQGEETIDMSTSMNIKMIDANKETMKYYAEGKTSAMGQDMDMTMFYEDGYYYMDMAGQKIKYPMDIAALMETVKQSTESSTMDSAYMKDIKAKKDGDNQVLTFTMDAAKMDEYVKDIMANMSTMTAGMEGVEYTIKEASGDAVVSKDGYFTSVNVKMVMEMSMQGETISVDMDTKSVYNNIGQPVELPAVDLEGYTEVDPAALGLQ